MDLQLQAALDEFSVLAVWSAITICWCRCTLSP